MIIDTEDMRKWGSYPPFEVVPSKTALVIIDMINMFCDPNSVIMRKLDRNSYFLRELHSTTILNCQRLLTFFRQHKLPVIHAVQGHWTLDGRDLIRYMHGRPYELFSSPQMSPIKELEPQAGEIIMHKLGSSAFSGTGLNYLLHNMGTECLVLTGQYSNACVFTTLINARELGYNSILVKDASVASREELHEIITALVAISWGKVLTTNEIIGELKSRLTKTNP